MTLSQLIATRSRLELAMIVGVATVAGVTNLIALAIISAAARHPDTAGVGSFLLFALCVVLHVWTARLTFHRMSAVLEDALHVLKLRIADKIERADLERLEQMGAPKLLDQITSNLDGIARAADTIGSLLQALFVLVVAILYMVWLSPASLFVMAALGLATFYVYRVRGAMVTQLWRAQARARVQFLETLFGLLKGAKEIKLNRARGTEFMADYRGVAYGLRDVATRANHLYYDNGLFMAGNLYMVLAALVFLLPQHTEIAGATLATLVAITLFIWGSIRTVVDLYPTYLKARLNLQGIHDLERELGTLERTTQRLDPWHGTPGRIVLSQMQYEYPSTDGDPPFHAGPIDLIIEPGETLFIVGGNGTGKSTLLKLITGLYAPSRGSLRVGEHAVDRDNIAGYREMISAIFSDSYLFSKVYGLLQVDEARVHALLETMRLSSKTAFSNGRFTSRDLSTGQRKRLAMVVALLEDRPIIVLDEWAADQDPEFRRYFYEVLLPALKQQGKTVIAVSHDSRYFHHADRVVVMDDGMLRTSQPVQDARRGPALVSRPS